MPCPPGSRQASNSLADRTSPGNEFGMVQPSAPGPPPPKPLPLPPHHPHCWWLQRSERGGETTAPLRGGEATSPTRLITTQLRGKDKPSTAGLPEKCVWMTRKQGRPMPLAMLLASVPAPASSTNWAAGWEGARGRCRSAGQLSWSSTGPFCEATCRGTAPQAEVRCFKARQGQRQQQPLPGYMRVTISSERPRVVTASATMRHRRGSSSNTAKEADSSTSGQLLSTVHWCPALIEGRDTSR